MNQDTRCAPVPNVPEADWVVEMREHFARYGKYRQSDLERVLGSPLDTVKVDASGHLELACRVLDHGSAAKKAKKK